MTTLCVSRDGKPDLVLCRVEPETTGTSTPDRPAIAAGEAARGARGTAAPAVWKKYSVTTTSGGPVATLPAPGSAPARGTGGFDTAKDWLASLGLSDRVRADLVNLAKRGGPDSLPEMIAMFDLLSHVSPVAWRAELAVRASWGGKGACAEFRSVYEQLAGPGLTDERRLKYALQVAQGAGASAVNRPGRAQEFRLVLAELANLEIDPERRAEITATAVCTGATAEEYLRLYHFMLSLTRFVGDIPDAAPWLAARVTHRGAGLVDKYLATFGVVRRLGASEDDALNAAWILAYGDEVALTTYAAVLEVLEPLPLGASNRVEAAAIASLGGVEAPTTFIVAYEKLLARGMEPAGAAYYAALATARPGWLDPL